MRLAVLSVHCTSTQLMPIGGQSMSSVVSMTIATLAPAITKPIAPSLWELPAAHAAHVVGLPPVHIKIPNQGKPKARMDIPR